MANKAWQQLSAEYRQAVFSKLYEELLDVAELGARAAGFRFTYDQAGDGSSACEWTAFPMQQVSLISLSSNI